MEGANEFANLFDTGQYGRLYIVSSRHARGPVFHIFVLPEGVEAIPNGKHNPPLNEDAVEVYGVIGGQRGWTEYYGWLHNGKWQEDFMCLVEAIRKKAQEKAQAASDKQRELEHKIREKEKRLLSSYR